MSANHTSSPHKTRIRPRSLYKFFATEAYDNNYPSFLVKPIRAAFAQFKNLCPGLFAKVTLLIIVAVDTDLFVQLADYARNIDPFELAGLITGLLCVLFLIRQNVLTWVFGILYVLVSFIIFWKARLYGDFILHIFYLVLNIYGWYHWIYGGRKNEGLRVSDLSFKASLYLLSVSFVGIYLFARFLLFLPELIDGLQPPSLPYWDSTTSMLSVTGMWLTAQKKIENWYYWLAVNILATGIYFYKDLYFYSALYFIYIGLAIVGLREWRKSMKAAIPDLPK